MPERQRKNWEETPLGEIAEKKISGIQSESVTEQSNTDTEKPETEDPRGIVIELPRHEDGLDDKPNHPAERIWEGPRKRRRG